MFFELTSNINDLKKNGNGKRFQDGVRRQNHRTKALIKSDYSIIYRTYQESQQLKIRSMLVSIYIKYSTKRVRTREMKIKINDVEITSSEPITILEAAAQHKIKIPTLCHSPNLSPIGVCRVCVVEVTGMGKLVGACHTPIEDGMVIRTDSPKAVKARKVNIELLLTAHTGDCVTDPNAQNCELHLLASELEVGAPRYHLTRPRFYPIEENNPYVRRDLSKCILCRKCISACSEIAKKGILCIGYRGFKSKIVYGQDETLDTDLCKDCGICIEYCPTGALGQPRLTQSLETQA